MSESEHELRVTHAHGSRFRIVVRGHELFVDQPLSTHGADTAPTPTELFVASVAACAAYYGRTYLARRGLPDTVDVTARWRLSRGPDRVAHVSLLVDAPGVPRDKLVVFRRVLEGCLVHNTLKNPCDVEIQLSSPPGERCAMGKVSWRQAQEGSQKNLAPKRSERPSGLKYLPEREARGNAEEGGQA